jgi:hypothetical protein
MPEFSPGFYLACGDRGFSEHIPRRLDRFYYNLREEGAVAFIRHVTRRLNSEGLAFRAKVVDEPGMAFDRCDSAVLAFERRDRDRSVAAAYAIHAALEEFLEPQVPALTRPLASGLAFAEDPAGRESYGVNRSLLVAQAVVAAHERGVRDPEERLHLVRERFMEAGTSLATPYLSEDTPGDLAGTPPVDSGKERAACHR